MKVEVEITRKDIASIEALIAYVDGDDEIDPSEAKRNVRALAAILEEKLLKAEFYDIVSFEENGQIAVASTCMQPWHRRIAKHKAKFIIEPTKDNTLWVLQSGTNKITHVPVDFKGFFDWMTGTVVATNHNELIEIALLNLGSPSANPWSDWKNKVSNIKTI